MNTAPRLGFTASLKSDHLRNCTPGTQPTPLAAGAVPSTLDTPKASLEGVTLCPCCNGAGYRQTDLHEAERCPFC